MKRRDFLKILYVSALSAGFAPGLVLAEISKAPISKSLASKSSIPNSLGSKSSGVMSFKISDDQIKDYLLKMRDFNKPHKEDIIIDKKNFALLESSLKRLKSIQRTVGHGNFYLLSFDEAIKIARTYAQIGEFTKKELDFLEMLFNKDASEYGFYGEKPLKNITDAVPKGKVIKVAGTGNFLYKGKPLETYKTIRHKLGKTVILTSGIRSIIKQNLLFLDKAYSNNGNLSLASRSLAPPGYSFHSISDFDVGDISLGAANFTERFIDTDVYKKLRDMGYLTLRYPRDNMLGVRFEPWHIKMNSNYLGI